MQIAALVIFDKHECSLKGVLQMGAYRCSKGNQVNTYQTC